MSRNPGDADREGPRKEDTKLGSYLRYSGVGIQFLVSVLLCIWGGWWLDDVAGTSPLFLVLGAFLGFAAGTWTIYKDLFGRRP